MVLVTDTASANVTGKAVIVLETAHHITDRNI
jgi:hypothetical protein